MALNDIFLYVHTHIYTHGVYSTPGWFTPVRGTRDFPDVTSLVNPTGRQAGRSPGDPSLIPLGASALGAAAVIAQLRF